MRTLLRRFGLVAVLAIAGGGGLATWFVTRAPAGPTCSISWNNAGGGAWNTAANWTDVSSTHRVPSSTDDVCITLAGTYTVTLNVSSSIQSLTLGATTGAQTLVEPASNTTFTLTNASSIGANGILTIGDATSGQSVLNSQGAVLTNSGVINAVAGGGGVRYLRANITNAAGGTVDIAGTAISDGSSGATTTTNNGTFIIESTGTYNLTGASFVNTGGNIANSGTLNEQSQTFTERGGSTSGTPVTITSGTLDDDTTAAAAQFLLTGNTIITGTGTTPGISATQTVTLDSNNSQATEGTNLTNDGILTIGDAATGQSVLNGQLLTLTNNGQLNTVIGGGGARYLRANITNATNGTVTIASATTLSDGSGGATTTTNNGTLTVETGGSYSLTGASFVNTGGNIANSGTLNEQSRTFTERGGSTTGTPVTITSGTLDDDTTAAAAQFLLTGNTIITGTGTNPGIAANQTVTLDSNNSQATMTLGPPTPTGCPSSAACSLTNDGTITIGTGSSGQSVLNGQSVTLINKHQFNTVTGGLGVRYLRANITNAAGGTVDIAGTAISDGSSGATTTTNNGTFIIESTGTYNLTGASFVNTGGNIANSGTLNEQSQTFTERGGSTSGTPVTITSGTLDDDTTAAAAQFLLTGNTIITGTGTTPGISATQTVTLDSNNSQATEGTNLTNDGILTIGDAATGQSVLNGQLLTLTNNGQLNTVIGGGGARYLRANITNATNGTVTIASATTLSDGSGGATTTTNNGTLTVETGGSYSLTGASFVNTGGNIANSGTLNEQSRTFTERGGSTTGTPVTITSGTLDDDTTAAAAQFLLTGNTIITGTGTNPGIAANQTVTLDSNNSQATEGTNLTNDGTLTIGDAATGQSVFNGQTLTLTNDGHLNTVAGGGGARYLRANITNATNGTVDIASATTLSDGSGGATTTTNNGTFIIESTGNYNLSGGTFTPGSTGTMQFDLASATVFGHLAAGTAVGLTGTANPVPQAGFVPTPLTEFDVITASHSSAFTTVDNNFSGDYSHPAFVGLVAGSGVTTTSLTSSLNPSTFGQAVTFTATVAPASGTGTPTGTVTFLDGTTPVGTGTVGSDGTATLTTSTLSPTSHQITAAYGGDSTFAASQSAPVTQVVSQTATSTGVTSSLNPSAFGNPVTFTATVTVAAGTGTPTGPVTFTEGTTPLGTSSLGSGGTATLTTSALAPASHPITATYGGDLNFSGSASTPLSQAVNMSTTAVGLSSSVDPSAFGQSVTFIASVAAVSGAGTPTGTVTFSDGTTAIGSGALTAGSATLTTSSLSVGTHPITATYGGDVDFTGSASTPLSQAVGQSATATALTSSQNPSTVGQSVTFTASVTGAGATPTGSVTFLDGSTTIGSATLTGGTATFSTTALAAGTHQITATYSGDTNYSPSTSPALAQAVGQSATTTGLTSSANPSTTGQSLTFTATVTGVAGAATPTGTVNFLDGSTTIGSATLTGGTATFSTTALAAGTHQITATYSGDTNYSPSTSPALAQAVGQSATTTGLTSSANPSTTGQSVTFTATVTGVAGAATPTGTVNFLDGATSIGSGSLSPAGTATFSTTTLGAGAHQITAAYSGDTNYTSSSSAVLNQTVNSGIVATTTTLASSANPSTVGQPVTFTATVTPASGTAAATGTVTFSSGATTLGTATVQASGKATLTTSAFTAVTAIGGHSVVAAYAGAPNFGASTSTVVVQQVAPAIYVADVDGDDVGVINGATNGWFQTISTGHFGFQNGADAVVNPAGTFVYVSNPQANTVTVINTATDQVTASIGGFNIPTALAVSPDGTKVYVTNEGGNTLSTISTASNTVTATLGGFAEPNDIVLNPAGTKAYVVDDNLNVRVVSLTGTPTATSIPVGGAQRIAVSPSGALVYVTNGATFTGPGGGTVTVINGTTNAVTATIGGMTSPQAVVFGPDGGRAYVVNANVSTAGVGDGFLSVINAATTTVVATADLGPAPGADDAVSRDGHFVYVGGNLRSTNTLLVVNAATDAVTSVNSGIENTTAIAVGPGAVPISVTLTASATTPAAGQPVVLTATASQNVGPTTFAIDIIDQATGKVLTSCGTGTTCTATVTNPAGSHSYEAAIGNPAGTNLQALSAPLTVTWGVATVSLDASPTNPVAGTPVTLTATANENVGPTNYAIDIVDQATGKVIVSCGTGSTCSTTVTNPTGSHTYQAVIASPSGRNVQASSAPVTVTWAAPSITLSASNQSPRANQLITLTATANENVGPTAYAIDIIDLGTGQVVVSCGTGTTCSTRVANRAGTHTYEAVIAKPSGSNVQATSPTVVVRWS